MSDTSAKLIIALDTHAPCRHYRKCILCSETFPVKTKWQKACCYQHQQKYNNDYRRPALRGETIEIPSPTLVTAIDVGCNLCINTVEGWPVVVDGQPGRLWSLFHGDEYRLLVLGKLKPSWVSSDDFEASQNYCRHVWEKEHKATT